jgi:basic membrane protein A and related proteins
MSRRSLLSLFMGSALAVSASIGAATVHHGVVSAANNSNFKACLVVGGTTVNDKSFAQATWEGLQMAHSKLGVTVKYVTSNSPNDYQPNMEAMYSQHCNLIYTIGFDFGDTTAAAAKAHPDQKYAIEDYSYSPPSSEPNVQQIIFQTDQAAFLAGYVSAGVTKTGKLGTYGGQKFPTVTIFMNGFEEGMNYYNHVHKAHVQLLGWNDKTQNGLFTGDFVNEDNGRRVTESLLQQGADIILPVAGQVGLGSTAAVKAAGKGMVVWVDTDGCVSSPENCSVLLTTVEKHMAPASFNTVKKALNGKFKGGNVYVGTLKNKGVGIAPYHDLKSKVPAALQKEVKTVQKEIISGKIKIDKWK